jgi:hypothetical protein
MEGRTHLGPRTQPALGRSLVSNVLRDHMVVSSLNKYKFPRANGNWRGGEAKQAHVDRKSRVSSWDKVLGVWGTVARMKGSQEKPIITTRLWWSLKSKLTQALEKEPHPPPPGQPIIASPELQTPHSIYHGLLMILY